MRNIIESFSNILTFMRSEQAQVSDEIQPQEANGKTPITILVVTAKKINNMVDQPTILIVSVEISKSGA